MAEGVEVLTVYAFSTENWNRTHIEIDTLFSIFAKYINTLQKEAIQNNVRVKILSTGMSGDIFTYGYIFAEHLTDDISCFVVLFWQI